MSNDILLLIYITTFLMWQMIFLSFVVYLRNSGDPITYRELMFGTLLALIPFMNTLGLIVFILYRISKFLAEGLPNILDKPILKPNDK